MSDVLSVAEAALLARDLETRPWKQAFVCLLNGPLTRHQLIDRATDRLDYAPRFRRKTAGWPVAAWVDDIDFAVSGHVREHSLAPGRPLQDWLAERLSIPFDRSHPLWEAWLVHGAVRSLPALVVFSHPALVDGYDNVHLLQELFDEQPEQIVPPSRRWRASQTAEPGLGDLVGRLDDPLRALPDAGAALSRWLENAARGLGAAARPHYVAGVEIDLATLRRVRDSFGCTTHDVLLTLVTAGVRGWLVDHGRSAEDVIALVPLAVAEPDVLGSAIGARIAPQWIALPVSENTPQARLRDLATLTRARLDTGVSVPAADLSDLAGFALPTLQSLAAATVAAGRPHTVFVGNAPGPTEPRYLGPARVTGVYSLIATTDEQECTVSISSYAGRVTIGITAVREARSFARDISHELGVLRAGR